MRRTLNPCCDPLPDGLLDCPTGKSLRDFQNPLSSPASKNILIFRNRKSVYTSPVLLRQRGARDRHGRGAGCGGRGGADNERRVMRTAKSCGPDAPTLASSSWEASFSGMTVANKPGHWGERDISRKPLRGECRVLSGATVVTNARAFY